MMNERMLVPEIVCEQAVGPGESSAPEEAAGGDVVEGVASLEPLKEEEEEEKELIVADEPFGPSFPGAPAEAEV